KGTGARRHHAGGPRACPRPAAVILGGWVSTVTMPARCSARISGTSGTGHRGGAGGGTRTPQRGAREPGGPPGPPRGGGCGEGADAIWLAQAGWSVVGADISGVALERAAQHASDTDQAGASRIEWRKADLLAQPPKPGSFDLVSAQFIQMPPDRRVPLFG